MWALAEPAFIWWRTAGMLMELNAGLEPKNLLAILSLDSPFPCQYSLVKSVGVLIV